MSYLHLNRALILAILISGLGIDSIRAQTSLTSAGMAGAPFRLGFGARGIGMGNSMSAITLGDINSYYNPALLPFQLDRIVLLSYGSLTFDRRLNFASYAQHVNPDAGISIGIINAGVSNIDGRDRDGQRTETYSTSENQFFLSFGVKPSSSLAIGVTTKVLYYSLYRDVSSTTVGLDFGALYSISDELHIAIVVQDVLSKYKWDTSRIYGQNGSSLDDKFPLRKRLGLSYSIQSLGVVLSTEGELMENESIVRFGAEIDLFSGLQLRGGIDQLRFAADISVKPSIGFSAQTEIGSWSPRFDYAYVFEPYSSSAMHFLTLSLKL
jgi:hypothetical protein